MRLMKSKIIGLIIGELFLFAAIIGAQALAFANGAGGGFYAFIDFNSLAAVLGVGWGITLMQEHGIEKNQYGKTLYKKSCFRWMDCFHGRHNSLVTWISRSS